MTEAKERLHVQEIIVVEGIHDKQQVDAVVEADVVVLGGDRIGQRIMDVLRRASAHRGVIVLTDPDGAGERIRRRIDKVVPGCKHAHVPRSAAISAQGLGVEHTAQADILAAIVQARPSQAVEEQVNLFTLADLLQAGLMGCAQASERRAKLGDVLGIGYGNAKAFLRKLNTLGVTRAEWEAALERL